MRRPPDRGPAGASGAPAPAFLILGYVCVVALALNLAQRMGWLHARLPGLGGSSARWMWVLATAVCFALTWYLERGRSPRT